MWPIRYGVGLLLLGIAPLFFVGGTDWTSPPLYRTAWGAGHMLFFALFTLWLHNFWSLHPPRRWLWLTLGVVALSLMIEVTQSFIGRDGNWRDGFSNLVGTWFALFWLQPAGRLVWSVRLLATALLLWQLQPMGQALLNLAHRVQAFPVLSDFEHPRDLHHWHGDIERVREPVAQGRYSLAFTLAHPDRGQQAYTGVQMSPVAGDWCGYERLAFSLYSERELVLTLRINDRHHDRYTNDYNDRFNHRLELSPGWNHVTIPLAQVRSAPAKRAMNMAEVQRLMLFTGAPVDTQTLYLDNLRLE